jgi:hypothetical protein
MILVEDAIRDVYAEARRPASNAQRQITDVFLVFENALSGSQKPASDQVASKSG